MITPQTEHINSQYLLMPKSSRQVLAENVAALRQRRPDLGGLRAWSKKFKVGEATLHRILHADAAIKLDAIEAVARGFGIAPWMLLVPELDPDNLPVSLSAAERDLYRRLQQAVRATP